MNFSTKGQYLPPGSDLLEHFLPLYGQFFLIISLLNVFVLLSKFKCNQLIKSINQSNCCSLFPTKAIVTKKPSLQKSQGDTEAASDMACLFTLTQTV